MLRSTHGSSTIESLVALIVFAVGALGASGVMALSLRLSTEGDRAAAAARLLSDEANRLRASLSANGGRCSGVAGSSRQTPLGVLATSAVSPVQGGLSLRIAVSYPTVRGQHGDTAVGFLACH